MYLVVNKSSGIVVARFLKRSDAYNWLTVNDVNEIGFPTDMYEIRKDKTQ